MAVIRHDEICSPTDLDLNGATPFKELPYKEQQFWLTMLSCEPCPACDERHGFALNDAGEAICNGCHITVRMH